MIRTVIDTSVLIRYLLRPSAAIKEMVEEHWLNVPKSSQKRIRSPGCHRPTGIPGLMLHPPVLLLNLVVRSAEDNVQTDGVIPLETVNRVTALIRHAYDFSDLDRSRSKGMSSANFSTPTITWRTTSPMSTPKGCSMPSRATCSRR